MNRRDAETQRKDPVSETVIGFCIQIHRELGPGLLLINFNTPVLVRGVKRLVNNYVQDSASLRLCGSNTPSKNCFTL